MTPLLHRLSHWLDKSLQVASISLSDMYLRLRQLFIIDLSGTEKGVLNWGSLGITPSTTERLLFGCRHSS